MTAAAQSLYAAIMANPFDFDLRKIFADEIQPDEPERSEFIRVQLAYPKCFDLTCECPHNPNGFRTGATCPKEVRETWEYIRDGLNDCGETIPGVYINTRNFKGAEVTVLRGFPDSVSLTLAAFVGGPCPVCQNPRLSDILNDIGRQIGEALPCPRCKGTHTTPGLARDLFSRWPVTAVRLVDREPMESGLSNEPTNWVWMHRSAETNFQYDLQDLPSRLFDRLTRKKRFGLVRFKTKESAHAALSRAAVDYGRELAGLPAIKWPPQKVGMKDLEMPYVAGSGGFSERHLVIQRSAQREKA